MPDTVMILDDYCIQAEGDLELAAMGTGKQLSLLATDSGGSIQINAADNVLMTVGTSAVAVESGKAIVQGQTSVKIGAGAPLEMGAVIDLSATSITIALTPLISITLGPAGVEIKAVETTLKVGVEGVTVSGPLLQESAEAAKKVSATLEQQAASATRQFNAGVDMLG